MKKAVAFALVALVAAALAASYAFLARESEKQAAQTAAPRPSQALVGAGATFLAPQMIEWARAFTEKTGIRVDYQSVGSGAGRDMFFKGVVHFAGSDPPLSKELYEAYKGRVLQLPVVVGSVAVVYNLPELPTNATLCLDAETVALIYKGEVRFWDDERIKRLNPSLAHLLPHAEIVAVHRSDSSGTTNVFTAYLHKAAPSAWPLELVGLSIDWPVDRAGKGVGGKGNEGVSQLVLATPYSLGYVELSYALTQGMRAAALVNADGKCVLPTPESVEASLKSAALKLPSSPLDDYSEVLWVLLNAPGERSYPIASFSYIFVWRDYGDKATADAVRKFVEWLMTEGQRLMVPGYLPVPDEVRAVNLKAVELIEPKA